MIARFLEWLGRAKWLNEDISSDALRIASLEAALEKAKKERDWWEQRCRAKSLDLVGERVRCRLQAKLAEAQPLVAYALRQKANRAKYDAKRRAK